jgi:outer membrane protein, heavy metal efflux system
MRKFFSCKQQDASFQYCIKLNHRAFQLNVQPKKELLIMMIDVGNLNFSEKKFRRWIPLIYITLTAILILMVNGCTGSLGKANEQAMEHWLQQDRELYSGQKVDLQSAVHARQGAEPDPDLPENAAFEDYVHYAIRHNPGLEAAFYRWRAALERVPQVRALPDPQVSFGILIDEVDRSAEYMGERYSISQMFPWFGKLDLRGDIALKEAYAESGRFEALRLQLIEQVGQAYFEYAYLHQAIAIARENLGLLTQLETVSRALFRAGTVSLVDINRAQVEIGRLEDQVNSLEDLLGVAAAELNAVLGRPAHAYLPPVSDRSSYRMVIDLDDYSDEEWLALAKENNPELIATRHDAEQQQHAIELARKDYFPDVTFGIEYARDGSARIAMMDGGGSDMLSLMVSINLPVWREKYASGAREMMARYLEATRQIQDRENNLETDLKRALYTYRDSRRKLDLYDGTLLPKANQSLTVAQGAYRAGDTGFSDLIDSQRILLEFALARERAAADYAQAIIRVRTLIGHDPGFGEE